MENEKEHKHNLHKINNILFHINLTYLNYLNFKMVISATITAKY